MRQELVAIVGKIIARHRAAMAITHEQLSLALDDDPITISRFERSVSLPSLLTIQRLCEIFAESAEPQTANGESAALQAMLDTLSGEEREFAVDTLKRFCRLQSRQQHQ